MPIKPKSIVYEERTSDYDNNEVNSRGVAMDRNWKHHSIAFAMLVIVITGAGCSAPLTTREKGAGIGALGGAAAGGIIGAAVGHPGAGAAIGGALGLGAGALVGDQLPGQ